MIFSLFTVAFNLSKAFQQSTWCGKRSPEYRLIGHLCATHPWNTKLGCDFVSDSRHSPRFWRPNYQKWIRRINSYIQSNATSNLSSLLRWVKEFYSAIPSQRQNPDLLCMSGRISSYGMVDHEQTCSTQNPGEEELHEVAGTSKTVGSPSSFPGFLQIINKRNSQKSLLFLAS